MKTIKLPFKYELQIGFILSLILINTPTPYFDRYVIPSYIIDYSTGLGDRKFVGTLFNLFFGDYISSKELWIGTLITYMLTIVLLSICMGHLLRKARSLNRPLFITTIIFIMLYIIGPWSFAYLFFTSNWGRIDIYMFLVTSIFIMLFCSKRRNILYYGLVFLLSAIGVLVHSVFSCTFYILFISLFIFDIANNYFNTRMILGYGLNILILFILFCYIHFKSSMTITLEETLLLLNNKTDIEIERLPIFYMHYAKLQDHITDWIMPNLWHLIGGVSLTILLLLPFEFFIGYIIVLLIKNTEKPLKYIYLIMFLCYSLSIPIYFITTDHVRWLGIFFFCIFAQFGVLLYKTDQSMLTTINIIYSKAKTNPFFVSILLLYAFALPYFESFYYPKPVEIILHFFNIVPCSP